MPVVANHLMLVIAALLLPATAAARQTKSGIWDGFETGASYTVRVDPGMTTGLESAMPRRGAYARGIDADLRSQWDLSYREYRAAVQEFRQLAQTRPALAKLVAGWIDKAEFQAQQSSRLRHAARRSTTYYTSWRWQRMISPHAHYSNAVAKHNKWLAIRAFKGRAPARLAQAALNDYRQALQLRASYTMARLGLAALYHELGDHSRGRQEFARISQAPSNWMALALAYYHCAAGDVDKALDDLRRAVRYSRANRRHALRSNDFDRLRGDPRFRKIVGDGL